MVASAMMSFGIDDLRDIPVNAFPEFAPAVVEIQTEALELSAEEVEDLITFSLGRCSAQCRGARPFAPGRSSIIPSTSSN